MFLQLISVYCGFPGLKAYAKALKEQQRFGSIKTQRSDSVLESIFWKS